MLFTSTEIISLIISLGFLQLVFYTQNALLFFLSLTNFSFKMHFYYRVDGLKMRRQTEYAGADPGFQVRGGALKKIAPSGGRREHFWGISCEKSRFYANKSYVFQLPREVRKFLRYFV